MKVDELIKYYNQNKASLASKKQNDPQLTTLAQLKENTSVDIVCYFVSAKRIEISKPKVVAQVWDGTGDDITGMYLNIWIVECRIDF